MFIKKLFIAFVFFTFLGEFALADETIKAENNAYRHNNKGLIYVREKYYYGAIKEFKMAIDLNPNTQATAVYFNNLGNVYYKLEFSRYAAQCYENARTLYPLNIEYYKNLAKAYKQMGALSGKIQYYSKSKNVLDKVLLGFMYLEAGNKQKAMVLFDSFCMTEPDLMLTSGVKYYMRQVREGTYQRG